MKKILETILGLSCAICIVFAGAQNPNGTCNFWWTVCWLTLAVPLGLAWGRYFNRKPVHITDEAYIELQRQIQDAVDGMEDRQRMDLYAEASLPDELTIRITAEMRAQSSSVKFKDDAWAIRRPSRK